MSLAHELSPQAAFARSLILSSGVLRGLLYAATFRSAPFNFVYRLDGEL